MPLPVVVIELAPPNPPVELSRSLVSACTRALDQGRCSLVADEPDNVVPHAIAIVSWEGRDQLSVRIEVGIRRTERARWLSRTMSFRAEDDPAERWKAAGLTVATLVGEVAPPVESGSTTEPAPGAAAPTPNSPGPARRTARRPSSPAESRPSGALLEAGVRVGTGLESGALRLGDEVAAAYESHDFFLQPLISAGYALQLGGSSDLTVSWTTVGAGAAAEFSVVPSLSLRARSELILQRVGVSATGDSNSTQSGAAWKPGWLVGGDVLWPMGGWLALSGGIDCWTTTGRVKVRVRGSDVGEEPVFGVGGRIALRLRIP